MVFQLKQDNTVSLPSASANSAPLNGAAPNTAAPYTTNFSDWYVVQCKSRQEQRAKENIENQQGEALLFQRPVEKIRRGKRVTLNEYWFPGYVFVRLPQDCPLWASIRSTYGVQRLVRFGEQPVPIRPETFKKICNSVGAAELKPQYVAGDAVQVKAGPLAGMEAIFANYDGTARAVLLINFLHREQSVKVNLADFG